MYARVVGMIQMLNQRVPKHNKRVKAAIEIERFNAILMVILVVIKLSDIFCRSAAAAESENTSRSESVRNFNERSIFINPLSPLQFH